MDDYPDIASVAGLIGDRARAEMLLGLLGGEALTASELARAAGVTKQTASAHLGRLAGARLVVVECVGRHHYYRLASHEVAAALERLVALAERTAARRVPRPGPPAPALRRARRCYDHLAGDLGVRVFDSLVQRKLLAEVGGTWELSAGGERFVRGLGVDLDALRRGRRPLCLACLDWSVRRHHLAGALGAALLERFLARGWARRVRATRVIAFPASGERALCAHFPLD